jgi:endonuclease G, mitochondrial
MPSDLKVSYKIIGENAVAVLSHFFKIVVDVNDEDNIMALSLLMPNKNLKGCQFGEYLVSVDEIERLAGLDFLSALTEGEQATIESQRASSIW